MDYRYAMYNTYLGMQMQQKISRNTTTRITTRRQTAMPAIAPTTINKHKHIQAANYPSNRHIHQLPWYFPGVAYLNQAVSYRVARESKPLSLIIIKSYYNWALRLEVSSISTTKWAQNIISLYWIFYVWSNFWRHHLLCLKLLYGWNQRIWSNHVWKPEKKRENMALKEMFLHKLLLEKSFRYRFTAC